MRLTRNATVTMVALATVALVILGTPFASAHLAAQWLKYPTAGVPRKPDGKVNMARNVIQSPGLRSSLVARCQG